MGANVPHRDGRPRLEGGASRFLPEHALANVHYGELRVVLTTATRPPSATVLEATPVLQNGFQITAVRSGHASLRLPLLVGGDEREAWDVGEQPVVGDERAAEPERSCGDPAV
jgi:hypothetical protein